MIQLEKSSLDEPIVIEIQGSCSVRMGVSLWRLNIYRLYCRHRCNIWIGVKSYGCVIVRNELDEGFIWICILINQLNPCLSEYKLHLLIHLSHSQITLSSCLSIFVSDYLHRSVVTSCLMVIMEVNRLSELSSNSGKSCWHFTLC